MRRGNLRTVTIYTVVYYDAHYSGPAADGTRVVRLRDAGEADAFARGRTCYGEPARVDCDPETPIALARRWGLA